VARACNAKVTLCGAVRIAPSVKETLVDLEDAFANIGLPGSTPDYNGAPHHIQSARAALRDDYAFADHLRRYYIMSRGRNAEALSDAS
jgi:hypothetical protein